MNHFIPGFSRALKIDLTYTYMILYSVCQLKIGLSWHANTLRCWWWVVELHFIRRHSFFIFRSKYLNRFVACEEKRQNRLTFVCLPTWISLLQVTIVLIMKQNVKQIHVWKIHTKHCTLGTPSGRHYIDSKRYIMCFKYLSNGCFYFSSWKTLSTKCTPFHSNVLLEVLHESDGESNLEKYGDGTTSRRASPDLVPF